MQKALHNLCSDNMGSTYASLKEILIACNREVPEHKHYFYSMFIQAPTRIVVKMNPAVNPYVNIFMEKESDYFKVVDEFINGYLAKYYNKKVIMPLQFNQIINLAILIPDIVEFLFKHSDEVLIFSTSQAYLSYAATQKVPLDFYTNLALVLVVDEMTYNLKKIKDPKLKDQAELRLNAIKMLTVNSMMALSRYTKIMDEKPIMDVKANPTDIFTYKDKAYGLKLFDGMNARVIIVLADRGCGKTIGLFRCIHSLLAKGYLVVVFGEDRRKEFRFAHFPVTQEANGTYYQTVHRQGTERTGMPLKIFCDDPEYPIEKDITSFKGTKEDWEKLSGVVLFESKKVTEKEIRDGFSKDKKGKINRETFKIIRKAELTRIMETFLKWRSVSRKKKVALAINEAQNIIGSTVERSTWGIFHESEKLFTDIRGLGVPVILNTQYISKLKKGARQNDVLFMSHITDESERRLIANIYNKPMLKHALAIPQMKLNHEFYKIEYGKRFKVKFLLPPYMPENELDLRKLYKIDEKS